MRSRLLDAAKACGLPRGEAEATISSGFAAGSQQPRMAPEPMPRWGADRARERPPAEPLDAAKLDWLFNPWEEPALPEFPSASLPEVLADWCADQHAMTGADKAGFTMAALAALSGTIDHRIKVVLKPGKPPFLAHSRLWVLLLGNPSATKSPIIRAATHELRALDAKVMAVWREADAERKAEAKAAKKLGQELPAVFPATVSALHRQHHNQTPRHGLRRPAARRPVRHRRTRRPHRPTRPIRRARSRRRRPRALDWR